MLSQPVAIFNIIKNNLILQFTLPTPNVDAESVAFSNYCLILSAVVENNAFLLYICIFCILWTWNSKQSSLLMDMKLVIL